MIRRIEEFLNIDDHHSKSYLSCNVILLLIDVILIWFSTSVVRIQIHQRWYLCHLVTVEWYSRCIEYVIEQLSMIITHFVFSEIVRLKHRIDVPRSKMNFIVCIIDIYMYVYVHIYWNFRTYHDLDLIHILSFNSYMMIAALLNMMMIPPNKMILRSYHAFEFNDVMFIFFDTLIIYWSRHQRADDWDWFLEDLQFVDHCQSLVFLSIKSRIVL